MGTAECGLQFDVGLPRTVEAATYSYRFRFDGGYDFAAGGKLPGLCSAGALCFRCHLLTSTLGRRSGMCTVL